MTLLEHLSQLTDLYDALEGANSTVGSAQRDLEYFDTTCGINITAEMGAYPTFTPEDIEAVERVEILISYKEGQPKYNFVPRKIANWGIGYFKEKAKSPDKPIAVKLEIDRSGKQSYDYDGLSWIVAGKKTGGFLGPARPLTDDFRYFQEVCQYGSPIEGVYEGGKQNIATQSFTDKYISNPGAFGSALRFHVGEAQHFPVSKKLGILSKALQLFFEAKGYEDKPIDIGEVVRERKGELRTVLERSKQARKEIDQRLETENPLNLNQEEAEFLKTYVTSLHPLLTVYAGLHTRFGEDMELDPLSRFVENLPKDPVGRFEDLASYAAGLERAIDQSNNKAVFRKLRVMGRELQDLSQTVNPQGAPEPTFNLLPP